MKIEQYNKLLDEICNDCLSSVLKKESECSIYCTLKEILKSIKPDARFIIQLKCVEKFKYEESARESKDIGWNDAFIRWSEKGYAKRFADLYNEDINYKALYKKIIDAEKN